MTKQYYVERETVYFTCEFKYCIPVQIHQFKYTNSNVQFKYQFKHTSSNINVSAKIYQFKYTSSNIPVQIYQFYVPIQNYRTCSNLGTI
jgi:hypothetical protein